MYFAPPNLKTWLRAWSVAFCELVISLPVKSMFRSFALTFDSTQSLVIESSGTTESNNFVILFPA